MSKHSHLFRILFPLTVVIALTFSIAGGTNDTRRRAVAPEPAKQTFGPAQKEAFLPEDAIAFIRPGLKIIVNSVTIGSNRIPVVDVSMTDGLDQPLDRLGKVTPGPISISFILAWYDPATRHYTSYTTRSVTTPANSPHPGVTVLQPGTDTGTFTDLETGHAKFTFKTVLPAGFDQSKTTTLGIYATRAMVTDVLSKNYYANVEFDFRPDGGTVTDVWDKMREAATCNNCHDPLSAHGGARQQVKLCVLCHQPQNVDPDTGNTVDFKVMVHKIHDGSSLPSVKAGTPYQIIGFGQAVSDWSTVVFPQDIRNCTTCHLGSNPAAVPKQNNVWYSFPSAAACGSCHDDVNFATGANHPGGKQADDSNCATCHQPQGVEFDASIQGAHTVPYKSKQLPGFTASIVSVTNVGPGKNPTVTYAIKNGDGTAIDGTKLTTFSPILAGPNTNYTKDIRREDGRATGVFSAASGTTSYTFVAPIPATATGSWTVSADMRRTITLKRGDGGPDIAQREAPVNPVKYVAVTGTTVTPRRAVVVDANCFSCHDRLALHGEQRKTTLECVICHNPQNDDGRPASAGPPESISFQRFIHRIHTGENLTQSFVVSNDNFNLVRFPGDTRNCAKCHSGTTFELPLQQVGIANVITLRDFFTPQGPATAACLGCHDNVDTAAHAFLNTVTFPGATTSSEACATCHGTGKEFAVELVHAR